MGFGGKRCCRRGQRSLIYGVSSAGMTAASRSRPHLSQGSLNDVLKPGRGDERASGDGEDGETERATRVKSFNCREADGEKHKIEKEEMETRWDSLHHLRRADDLHELYLLPFVRPPLLFWCRAERLEGVELLGGAPDH